MSRVVAIGDESLLAGYALAGVDVVDVRDAVAAGRAWDALPDDVGLVLLTSAVEDALGERLRERPVLWAAVPS